MLLKIARKEENNTMKKYIFIIAMIVGTLTWSNNVTHLNILKPVRQNTYLLSPQLITADPSNERRKRGDSPLYETLGKVSDYLKKNDILPVVQSEEEIAAERDKEWEEIAAEEDKIAAENDPSNERRKRDDSPLYDMIGKVSIQITAQKSLQIAS